MILTYLVGLSIALSIHRIWNYEDICDRPRNFLSYFKLAICPACNAWWILAGVALFGIAMGYMTWIDLVVFPMTMYWVLRGAVWIQANIEARGDALLDSWYPDKRPVTSNVIEDKSQNVDKKVNPS